ncbi:hypothetical protein [Gracilibacillus sp. YIM 98692]|uniref:hypothetical protein n=1 Tax=Gracilibacillus sp. YIM 98692 TaxID=2663532 RepID=UPI0013D64F45|nr:hypothetical protein [Gracilibacillus sp. YIM 98692]
MEEIKISKMKMEADSPELEVAIKGDEKNKAELKAKAIEFLMDCFDVKQDLDEDVSQLDKLVERFLFSAIDMVGYNHYYWGVTSDEDKQYNEYDELVVSNKAKIELLELYIASMKEKLNKIDNAYLN